MGRRVTVGTNPTGVGFTFFDANTITGAEENANLKFTPSGTGIIELLTDSQISNGGNLSITAQGDLRLYDADSSNYVGIQSPATITSDYTITLPDAVAARNKSVLMSDTSGNTSWSPASEFVYSVEASTFSAEAFSAYFVDTSSNVVTATLPASPTIGDTIRFIDVSGSFDANAFTVDRNGKVIMGDAADLTVDSENAAFDLVFSNDTYGWRIFSI